MTGAFGGYITMHALARHPIAYPTLTHILQREVYDVSWLNNMQSMAVYWLGLCFCRFRLQLLEVRCLHARGRIKGALPWTLCRKKTAKETLVIAGRARLMLLWSVNEIIDFSICITSWQLLILYWFFCSWNREVTADNDDSTVCGSHRCAAEGNCECDQALAEAIYYSVV